MSWATATTTRIQRRSAAAAGRPAQLLADDPGSAGGSRPTGTSPPEGVLDLRTALLDVALGPFAAAPGLQPPVAGDAAEGYPGGAFDRFGPVRDRLGETHGRLPFVSWSAGAGTLAGAAEAGWPFTGSCGSTTGCR